MDLFTLTQKAYLYQQAHLGRCSLFHFVSYVITPEDQMTENEEAPVSFEVYQTEVCREDCRDTDKDKGITNLPASTRNRKITFVHLRQHKTSTYFTFVCKHSSVALFVALFVVF